MNNIQAIYVGGVFRPLEEVPFAENERVWLTIESSPAPAAATPVRTAKDLLESGLVGSWADRADIQSSETFARQLRERAQTRGGTGHAAG